ncbi:hypothetical protein PFISCL1PPCAC_22681, partial [Pristionchus fissidentatus]
VQFLQRNPERNEYALSAYKEYGATGTFGGRSNDEKMSNHPVIFVHGNSDSALWFSEHASGWTKSVEYFKEKGFTGFELYGLTYGSRDLNNSLHNTITCRNLVGLRRFIESVIAYTQAEKIDIIAHSMGVSLARKAIQGGMVHMTEEACELGDSLANQVDAFVAISGANYGMCMCLVNGLSAMPACGQEGYTPGTCAAKSAVSVESCSSERSECAQDDYAMILRSINEGKKEASFVASLWSNDDAILGKNNIVWGRKTSQVPHSDLAYAYEGYNHFHTKDKTARDQFHLVTVHTRHAGRTRRHH